MGDAAFRGMILGVEYTDRDEFTKAAQGAGYRFGLAGRTGDWRVGLPVQFVTDEGTRYFGQVWAKGDARGTVVLALDGGRYARVYTSTGNGELINSRGAALDVRGKVAA